MNSFPSTPYSEHSVVEIAKRRFFATALLIATAVLWGGTPAFAAEPVPSKAVAKTNLKKTSLKNSDAVAAEVDRLILQTLKAQGVSSSAKTNDEDFLRRLYLDMTGKVPTSADVTYFGLNPDKKKRTQKIDEMVKTKQFATNWSAYWRDVIFSRATEDRSKAFQGTFESWLTEQLHENKSWAEITTEVLTATGNVATEGETGLMFAHQGSAEEIAAETSRVFLGVQVQCANCHDHPSDVWKREEFHQLAAFFPRVRVRRVQGDGPRSFEVASNNRQAGKNKGGQLLSNPGRVYKMLDKNKDGKISKEESKKNKQFARIFGRILQRGDADKDGLLSLKEFKALPRPQNRNRGRTEYYMPNLDDPQDKGTLTQPVFFLTKEKTKEGMTDLERRGALAKMITSSENEWFAKAFVNRVWGEMLGRGFYMPIDDIGPTKDADFPEALELLSAAFTANGHDIQWLYRTIARTDAYQRQTQPTGENSPAAFGHSVATRLRADQIYSSLLRVGGFQEADTKTTGRRGRARNARGQFALLFGFDPSTSQEDITGDIPQALFMMNSKQIQAIAKPALQRISKKHKDDKTALNEMYLLVLSRSPSKEEQKICLDHISQSKSKSEGFEDIMWGLLNSSEFISKR